MTENTLELEVPPPETGNSFTALLELPPNQAMELLHQEPVSRNHTAISAMEFGESTLKEQQYLSYASDSSPIFISNMDLIDRAARFSNFANIVNGDYISEMNFIPSNSSEVKKELTDSESNHSSSPIFSDKSNQSERKRSTKRKLEGEQKVKVSAGKSKRVGNVEDCKQLPYVHVRARRGQATDSHSLAERARREKINAKMKLLQEMVPGCAKITGTASVLDEIINHVQSLQHQVEILSMRLAAVNPRIDYNLDSLMVSQSGGLTPSSFASSVTAESSFWPGIQMNNITGHQYLHDLNQPHHQQVDMFQQPLWERETNQSFITSPENSVYSYNSTNSVALHPNQLKMEM